MLEPFFPLNLFCSFGSGAVQGSCEEKLLFATATRLEAKENLVGPEHHDTAFAYRVLAGCAYESGQLSLAKESCETAMQKSTPGSYWHGRCLELQGAIVLDLSCKQYGQVTKEVAATAVGLLQEGLLAVQATEVGGYHLVEALSRLATAQAHAQDAEARATAQKALELCNEKSQDTRENAHFAFLAVAEVSSLNGNHSEAERWYSKVENHAKNWVDGHPAKQRILRHLERSRQRVSFTNFRSGNHTLASLTPVWSWSRPFYFANFSKFNLDLQPAAKSNMCT